MMSKAFSRRVVGAIAALTMASAAHAGLIRMSSMVLTPLTPQAAAFLSGADPVFTFTDIGATVTSSGTLDATANGDGTFTVISGSGIFNGIAITLIPNPTPPGQLNSPTGFFFYDDQLLPGSNPVITNGGLLFSLASGPATELNIFSNGPGSYTTFTNDGFNEATAFALVTPEPSTGIIVLSGIFLLNLIRKNRTARAL